MRELGSSNELRRFFGHDPARWQEFRKRYLAELKRPAAKVLLAELEQVARLPDAGLQRRGRGAQSGGRAEKTAR